MVSGKKGNQVPTRDIKAVEMGDTGDFPELLYKREKENGGELLSKNNRMTFPLP